MNVEIPLIAQEQNVKKRYTSAANDYDNNKNKPNYQRIAFWNQATKKYKTSLYDPHIKNWQQKKGNPNCYVARLWVCQKKNLEISFIVNIPHFSNQIFLICERQENAMGVVKSNNFCINWIHLKKN